MGGNDRLDGAVRRAILACPASGCELARAAGVAPPTVNRIKNGRRGTTPETAEKVAGALDRWSSDAAAAADEIRRAVEVAR